MGDSPREEDRCPQQRPRVFSRAFREAAVRPILDGEKVRALVAAIAPPRPPIPAASRVEATPLTRPARTYSTSGTAAWATPGARPPNAERAVAQGWSRA